MVDDEGVVYVDGVADEAGVGTVSGTFDESEVRITAKTSKATRSSAATPAVHTTDCWSCQFGSSLDTAECYAQRCSICVACPDRAPCRNGPKLIRPTPSGPNDAGSS